MTKNTQTQTGRETQAQKLVILPRPPKNETRTGAVAIRWLVVILLALAVLVLLFNRMAKRSECTFIPQADTVQVPESPIVKLADIDNTSIGSSVTVVGKVLDLSPPPANSKRPYGLKLADDSGEKTITFWQLEYDQIPGKEALKGALVRVRVTVSSYQEKLQLKLVSGEDLEILTGASATAEPPAQKATVRDFSRGRSVPTDSLSVGAVTAAQDGQTVLVRGRVESIRAPKEGTTQPFSVVLKEGEASLRVVYWPTVDEVIAVKPTPGAMFEIEGVVSVYEGTPQIKVESGYKVNRVADAPIVAPVVTASKAVAISSITAAQDGQTVLVRGRVESIRPPKEGSTQPFAVVLKEGEASLRVVYWPTVDEVIAVKPTSGAMFEIEGVVSVYEGTPQIKVESGYKVKRVADVPVAVTAAPAADVAPPAENASPSVPISSITATDKGQTRVVKGILGTSRSLGKGVAYPLTDESGTIDLILWDSTIPAEVRGALSEGMKVSATGEVSEFDGKLQIKAAKGHSVVAAP